MKNYRYTLFLASLILMFSVTGNAQTPLSRFDFNSLPLTKATNGTNAQSVNVTAQTDGTGVYFNTGGTTVGLDLLVNTSSSFRDSLKSLEIHVEFAKNEPDAILWELANMKLYLENDILKFTYITGKNNGQSVASTLKSEVLPHTKSGQFSVFRAAYDATTGQGLLSVNGIIVDQMVDNSKPPLYWKNNLSAMYIGRNLDGSGNGFVTLGSIAIFNSVGNASLPVELQSFSAVKRSTAVQLRWTTITELNNFGFEIERSYDRKNWEMLDFVFGHGTVYSPRQYSWDDQTVLRGNHNEVHYRLRQIDRDGTWEHSSTVTVALKTSTGFALSPAFPNPFNPSTTFSLRLDNEENVYASVSDATGRIVSTLINNELLSAGTHNISFYADNLPSGIYYALVTAGSERAMIRLVLQK